MVSGWAGVERAERLVVVAVTTGKGSAGAVIEEKERRKKTAETANPPTMAPKIPMKATVMVRRWGSHKMGTQKAPSHTDCLGAAMTTVVGRNSATGHRVQPKLEREQ